jgi:hypothetical protein
VFGDTLSVETSCGEVSVDTFPLGLESGGKAVLLGTSIQLGCAVEDGMVFEVLKECSEIRLTVFGFGACNSSQGRR